VVLADSHGISRAPCYLGFNLIVSIFDYETITLFGLGFQLIRLIVTFNHLQLSRYPSYEV
jgi:hypothetical protein